MADDSEKVFLFLRTSEKFTFLLACNRKIKSFIIKSILERGVRKDVDGDNLTASVNFTIF